MMESKSLYFAVQWHITSNCLNKCKHCYMYNDNYITEDCTYEDFVSVFKNIENFFKKYNLNLPRFAITGGSPLMNPQCDEILKFLHSKVGNQVTLLDIPETLTEKNINLLKSCEISSYQMSLDGLKKVHDDIRGNDSFEKTINACRKLSEVGIEPHIMFTLSKDNSDQLMPLCKYLLKELEEFSFAYDFVVPVGNAVHIKGYISPEEAERILNEYYEFSKENSTNKKNFALKPSQYNIYKYLLKNESIRNTYSYPMISGCHIGWDSICVLQNGDVLPCRRLPIIIGNLKKETFEDIFLNAEILRKFRRFSQYQEKCGTCQYGTACRGCPAITYALTGDSFSGFDLCTYKTNKEYKVQHRIPDINCNKEEELNFIKNSMKNFIFLNFNNILTLYPNVVKYIRDIKRIKTQKEYAIWLEQTYNNICMDEQFCLSTILSSQKFSI